MSVALEASYYTLSVMIECILFCFQNKNLASAYAEFIKILGSIMVLKLLHVHPLEILTKCRNTKKFDQEHKRNFS